MQGNDISEYAAIAQGVVFDGLLATPPEGAKAILETIQRRRNNWDAVFRLWEPNDMPLRALSDSVNRLGLGTDIYTFTDADAVDAIPHPGGSSKSVRENVSEVTTALCTSDFHASHSEGVVFVFRNF